MDGRQFEVRRDNLGVTRIAPCTPGNRRDRTLVARIDRFALTANNVTYGVVGERIGYWKFFPAGDGWGVIPVWGFATVLESHHPDVAAGERLYGYFPTGTQLVLRPDKVHPDRFVDASEHRASLPLVYNAYARLSGEPDYDPSMDDERMLLYPLYATSYCLFDFLEDNAWFGAEQLVVVSASSKTAIGLAYAVDVHDKRIDCVGLTSQRNLERVRSLGLYDSVATYDALGDLDTGLPTVIVDMSGNGQVLSDLHALLGDRMRYTSNVGITHHDANDMGPHVIRERSAMFFAPGHIRKRSADWGPGEFQARATAFWREASIRSRDWLVIERIAGLESLPAAYGRLLAGQVEPHVGLIVEL